MVVAKASWLSYGDGQPTPDGGIENSSKYLRVSAVLKSESIGNYYRGSVGKLPTLAAAD